MNDDSCKLTPILDFSAAPKRMMSLPRNSAVTRYPALTPRSASKKVVFPLPLVPDHYGQPTSFQAQPSRRQGHVDPVRADPFDLGNCQQFATMRIHHLPVR